MNPVVLFSSVVSLVDRFPVLAGVDLSVDAGEIVLLRGPNGAGKTSLLRAIAGMATIHQGNAVVLGHDLVRNNRAVRSSVGFLGHQSTLYEELTVRENLVFAARARGVDIDESIVEKLGLSTRLSAVTVDRLSAGQRRRAALAVVIASDPQILLLDEPHTGLDADARTLLDELIASTAARGRTVIFSSHELVPAPRVVSIEGGVAREVTHVS